MQKIILIIVGLILIIAGIWYFLFSGNDFIKKGETVAVVNGEKVYRNDFESFKARVATGQGIDLGTLDAEVQEQLNSQILEELISQKLLSQAVEEIGIVPKQEDIDAQINLVIEQVGGQESFNEILVNEELTEQEFRTQVSNDLAIQLYLEQELSLSSISATDEEIESTYSQAISQNPELPSIDDARDDVRQAVIQQKQQELIMQLIERLRGEAEVEIQL